MNLKSVFLLINVTGGPVLIIRRKTKKKHQNQYNH